MADITPDELLHDLVTNNQDAAEIFTKLRDFAATDADITFNLSTGSVTVKSVPKIRDEFETKKDAAFEDFSADFRAPPLINSITYNGDGTIATIQSELANGNTVDTTYNYSGESLSSVDVVLKDSGGTQLQSFTRTLSYSGGDITGVN